MSTESIISTVNDELCLGCGTCFSICPVSAINISMVPSKGTYLPQINQEVCIKCGKCYQACPGHSIGFKQLNLELFEKDDLRNDLIGYYKSCYTGYATDLDIRFNSTSGGLVTAILLFALEHGLIDGALVTRMSKNDPLEVEPFIARTKEEIIGASKSKYCPVPANIALKQIIDSDDEKLAIVGLPCHIQGVRKAERISPKLKQKIVLHLGLFCGRCPSFIGTEFLLQSVNVEKSNVESIDYRGGGWPSGTSIILKNGNRLFIPHNITWGLISLFVPRRCTLCSDGVCELADISFADAWLPELSRDKMGLSLIINRSDIGERLLKMMASSSNLELSPIDASKITERSHKSMLYFKKNSLTARMNIINLLGKNIPSYDQVRLHSASRDYFSAIKLYLMSYLVERRILWTYFIRLFRLVIYYKKGYVLAEENSQ